MTVFSSYKPLRNKISPLAIYDSLRVIWAYSQYLQIDDFKIPPDIEVNSYFLNRKVPQSWISEWHLEILAKEIILNACNYAERGRTLRSWRTLGTIVNDLKNFENSIPVAPAAQGNSLILLNRIAHQQLIWQENRPNSVTCVRNYKIFNTLEINKICHELLDMSISEIYICGMAFLRNSLHHPEMRVPFGLDIPSLTLKTVEQFLSFTSRAIAELRSIFKTEQKYDNSFFHAYSSLRAFPLIRMTKNKEELIVCPLPTLLFWRFTGGLYYELIRDARFSQAFGDSFQEYVGQVVRRACPGDKIQLLSEQSYGTKQARKDSIDWIIADDDAAIFLECKAKRLSWDAKTAFDDLKPLEIDIEVMARAVIQTYKTIIDWQNGRYPHFSFQPHRKIYPIVVTLENWHFFGPVLGNMLQSAVITGLSDTGLPSEILQEMPFSVWHIGDLEWAIQIIREVGIRTFIDGKINDPEMRQWDWLAYIGQVFKRRFPYKKLFSEEYEDIFKIPFMNLKK